MIILQRRGWQAIIGFPLQRQSERPGEMQRPEKFSITDSRLMLPCPPRETCRSSQATGMSGPVIPHSPLTGDSNKIFFALVQDWRVENISSKTGLAVGTIAPRPNPIMALQFAIAQLRLPAALRRTGRLSSLQFNACHTVLFDGLLQILLPCRYRNLTG
ncbi:MAG: hypothetical protein ONB48_17525 [candidate division KSB1 bacterium]|nr:hypothetical protein [candidate division KSB1 bacterium]MDZ7275281.1 hypothetical protein [candidate division KSB1 bacterium]MDZ7287449.1 hypothetical protein [candidate division KSB1 bacterium]MDZ7299563.1 hypothetical protein [candidate division KSB1 bacterium]MDZ7308021.1 hypothetical protein [candidate division KSB1 bacterium]